MLLIPVAGAGAGEAWYVPGLPLAMLPVVAPADAPAPALE
jgi:hypothetical protein